MNTAESIWDKYITGKLTTKEALDLIGERLRTCTPKDTPKLLKLSEKILDRDVPMQDRNSDIEKAFWDSTHKEDEG